jgi:hypothetical protein
MTEEKSKEEFKEMHPDERFDYLIGKDIFTPEEWEAYKESITGDYLLREITNKSIQLTDGTEYLISVEHSSDGESLDEMNTRINVVEKGQK